MLKKLVVICVLYIQTLLSMVPFGLAMEEGYHPEYYKNSKRFEKYYEDNFFEKVIPSHEPLIPKIIHQIWIGGPVPEKFKVLMETWKEHHPNWEYKLWGDADIDSFPFQNPKAFFNAKNLGAKSDIWRYEILYLFGGVYVDVDFECIKPLDPLVYAHEFFAGIAGFDYVGNAIIGAKPRLSLFKKLSSIMNSWNPDQLNAPWVYTGPLIFTRQVYNYIKEHPNRAIVYPIKFFHPFPNTYRHAYWRQEITRAFIDSFFIPETFAVHYWAESWNK